MIKTKGELMKHMRVVHSEMMSVNSSVKLHEKADCFEHEEYE